MRKVRAEPADWVVKAAVQSNSTGSVSQRGSVQLGRLSYMMNDDKHPAPPSAEK